MSERREWWQMTSESRWDPWRGIFSRFSMWSDLCQVGTESNFACFYILKFKWGCSLQPQNPSLQIQTKKKALSGRLLFWQRRRQAVVQPRAVPASSFSAVTHQHYPHSCGWGKSQGKVKRAGHGGYNISQVGKWKPWRVSLSAAVVVALKCVPNWKQRAV